MFRYLKTSANKCFERFQISPQPFLRCIVYMCSALVLASINSTAEKGLLLDLDLTLKR